MMRNLEVFCALLSFESVIHTVALISLLGAATADEGLTIAAAPSLREAATLISGLPSSCHDAGAALNLTMRLRPRHGCLFRGETQEMKTMADVLHTRNDS